MPDLIISKIELPQCKALKVYASLYVYQNQDCCCLYYGPWTSPLKCRLLMQSVRQLRRQIKVLPF